MTELEIDILIKEIYSNYGYDFQNYARSSMKRRIENAIRIHRMNSIEELQKKIITDSFFFKNFLSNLTVSVTEMFRDPLVFSSIINVIIPILKTYTFINIWHAGCSTGEEVYSLAIILKENDLYDNSRIYATDINMASIEKARTRSVHLNSIQEATKNYQLAGGKKSFSNYYFANNGFAEFDKTLLENVTFSTHNLVTDGSFGEMHLILCRNVLIYFNKELQEHVLNLFSTSLTRNGFLCLGKKESIQTNNGTKYFSVLEKQAKIYQKLIN